MITFTLAPATLPPDRRVYAIGDVHGCVDRLESIHAMIRADLGERPVARPTVVHLGDFVDRGPDSRKVIELLMQPWPDGDRPPPVVVDLMGNHEAMMLDALATGSHAAADLWLSNGGIATLQSWGVDPGRPPSTWWGAVPCTHLGYLRGLGLMHRAGGYTFVHAGIRPDVTIECQSREDLLWIREPFLSFDGALPSVIVHGHTPRDEPEVRPHRVGIDTGAVLGGPLTCAVLEADQIGFLQA